MDPISPVEPPLRLRLTDGQLEALKWLALAAMFLDHVGRHLLGCSQDSWIFAVSRTAFPLFAIVLGWNLARPGEQAQRAARVTVRLFAWCGVSVIPSIMARGEPTMINVLGTLGLGAAMCWILASSTPLLVRLLTGAAIVFLSQWVEFGPVGVFLVGAVYGWRACSPGPFGALASILLLALGWQNALFGGALALWGTLGAVVITYAVSRLPVGMPRWSTLFYVLYPTHLLVIGLIKRDRLDPPSRFFGLF